MTIHYLTDWKVIGKVVFAGLLILAIGVYNPGRPLDNQKESLGTFETEAQEIAEIMKDGMPSPSEYLSWCEWRDERFRKVPGLEERVRQLIVQGEGE